MNDPNNGNKQNWNQNDWQDRNAGNNQGLPPQTPQAPQPPQTSAPNPLLFVKISMIGAMVFFMGTLAMVFFLLAEPDQSPPPSQASFSQGASAPQAPLHAVPTEVTADDSPGGLALEKGCPMEQYRRLLHQDRRTVLFCLESSLDSVPSHLAMTLEIDPQGTVSALKIADSMDNEEARRCIQRVVDRIRFPGHETEKCSLSYAFDFTE